jgi:hypothetical protein
VKKIKSFFPEIFSTYGVKCSTLTEHFSPSNNSAIDRKVLKEIGERISIRDMKGWCHMNWIG